MRYICMEDWCQDTDYMMAFMADPLSRSSSFIEQNLFILSQKLTRLLLLLVRGLPVGGEESMDQVSLFHGILIGKLCPDIFSTSSSTALLTAMARLAKSSRSFRLVCLLRFRGVSRLLLQPPLTIHG